MSKVFRAWDVDEVWLFPASVQDFVPPGHIAHLIRETVREGLDLRAILSQYDEERGYPPYHPGMMTALLLYAYSQGIYSSRRIDRACHERVDFMAVTGLGYPDFRTISEFRKRHLGALSGLFVQVLGLCRKAGLVKLGHVALKPAPAKAGGTKIKANASKHKAMSYGRMRGAEEKLAAEVAGWMKRRPLRTRPRIASTAVTGVVTNCPIGLPTKSGGWPRSARPRRGSRRGRHSRRRRKSPPAKVRARTARWQPSGAAKASRQAACPRTTHNAISPIPRAGS